jgi:hypothetical protein
MMDAVDPDTGKSKRQMVAEHLLEVATRWQVLVLGRNLEVASARDSVDAAKLLFSYDLCKPPGSEEESMLKIAEHLRTVARDHVEIGRQLLGKQAETWTPEQIRAFWNVCERDTARFIRAAAEQLAEAKAVTVDAQPSQPAIAAPGEAGSAERTDYGRGAEPVASTLQSARGDNSAPNADATVGTTPSTASNSTLDEDGGE